MEACLHGSFMCIYLEITCYSRVKCVVEDVIPPRQGRRPESIREIPKEMPKKYIIKYIIRRPGTRSLVAAAAAG